ncbi:hypothetical protein NPIL_581761 [Nephila pilipes]|uniref:Uncharacterized protein n=1 Tax=Nephila pilipes TaxID=299642 RepID=A0A8X6U6R2_NEPPI|nr:hypothetical protein NPIL_581761 [Nephila pilipes]
MEGRILRESCAEYENCSQESFGQILTQQRPARSDHYRDRRCASFQTPDLKEECPVCDQHSAKTQRVSLSALPPKKRDNTH